MEPIENQYVKVGQIAKAHGLDGTVVVIPEVNEVSVFESGELVRLKNDNGDLVPARIETSRAQEKNGRQSFLIRFGHISDRNQARRLRRMPVWVHRERMDHDHGQQPLKKLTSYTVCEEENQEAGIVNSILDNPAHPILVVQGEDKEMLVPLVGEYVAKIDEDKEIIYCQNLNQLAGIV